LLSALILASAQATDAAAGPEEALPLAVRVNHAIALGADFLAGLQRPDGTYPGHGREHPGGTTALATYTLLHCGVRRGDPVIARALAALAGHAFESVYSAAVHLLLLEMLRNPALEPEAQRSLDFLLEHQDRGLWAYPWGSLCNSNTQFALLGLRAARNMGLAVEEDVLVAAHEGLAIFQDESGAFGYRAEKRQLYAGITAASLASLAVLEEAAREMPRLARSLAREDGMRAGAERWFEQHYDLARNPYDDGGWGPTSYSHLWAVERWCDLAGIERIGGHDWYAEGATLLLELQAKDGSWGIEKALEETAFALLFLRRSVITRGEATELTNAELERLRAGRAERLRRPGPLARRLSSWWLAGPWSPTRGEPLLLDPPFDPGDAHPGAREKLARREWRRVELDARSWTDLEGLSAAGGDGERSRGPRAAAGSLWVLSTWLCVRAGEPAACRLWLELEDGWDLWLDGRRLSRERRRAAPIVPDLCFPLELTPGEHLLTVVVEDVLGAAAFGALLTGPDGGAPSAFLVDCPDPEKSGGR
jgi:hypothetical protein